MTWCAYVEGSQQWVSVEATVTTEWLPLTGTKLKQIIFTIYCLLYCINKGKTVIYFRAASSSAQCPPPVPEPIMSTSAEYLQPGQPVHDTQPNKQPYNNPTVRSAHTHTHTHTTHIPHIQTPHTHHTHTIHSAHIPHTHTTHTPHTTSTSIVFKAVRMEVFRVILDHWMLRLAILIFMMSYIWKNCLEF